jgi:cytochrome c oxidase accessory protein FixG
MGIDIREGNQLECITCALCIDACDGVMEKVGSSKGLISYSTLRSYNASAAGHAVKPNWHVMLRPRTLIYSAIWSLIGVVMVASLLMRDRLGLDVVPDRNPLFVTLSDGSVRDGYTVKILNMEARPRRFLLSLHGLDGASLSSPDLNEPKGDGFEIAVEADKLRQVKVFVEVPRDELSHEQEEFDFRIREVTQGETAETAQARAIFHGHKRKH